MTIKDLKAALAKNPDASIRFILPDGEKVPAHAHVTEVARLDKRFIDCGATMRNDARCQMQTWVANDLDHRLTAGKLLRILNDAASFLGSEDLPVDVEHEVKWTSQFPLEEISVVKNEVVLQLGVRHTACLAEDKCLPKPNLFKPLPTFAAQT